MIQNVIFDFADTIAELKPNNSEILTKYINDKLKIKIDEKSLNVAYYFLTHNFFYSSVKIQDSKTKQKYYRKFNSQLFKCIGLFHLVQNEIDDVFNYFKKIKRKWILKDNILELFQKLIKKNIKIGIISNFDKRLTNLVYNDFKLDNIIDYFLVSQEIGLEKPDIKFYNYFIKKFNINPSETLYIGDNYILDFLPAMSLGINALILDEKHNIPDNNKVIRKLDHILEHL